MKQLYRIVRKKTRWEFEERGKVSYQLRPQTPRGEKKIGTQTKKINFGFPFADIPKDGIFWQMLRWWLNAYLVARSRGIRWSGAWMRDFVHCPRCEIFSGKACQPHRMFWMKTSAWQSHVKFENHDRAILKEPRRVLYRVGPTCTMAIPTNQFKMLFAHNCYVE